MEIAKWRRGIERWERGIEILNGPEPGRANLGWGEIHKPIQKRKNPHPETRPYASPILSPLSSPCLSRSLRRSTELKWSGTTQIMPSRHRGNHASTL